MKELPHRPSSSRRQSRRGLAGGRSELRALLPDGRHRHPGQHDGGGCSSAVRPPLWPCRGQGGAPLGEDQGKGRLPRRQGRDRPPSCAGRDGGEVALPSWETASVRGLARQVGAEPDADQRVDAPLRPGRPAAGRRRFGGPGHRRVQIGGVTPVRGAVGGAHGGMDGGRPVQAGPADHPDRRHPHRGGPDAAGRRRHRRRTATSILSA